MAELTGKALLEKVKELGHLSVKEQARVCGYTSQSTKGRERIDAQKFLQQIAIAHGLTFGAKKEKSLGRSPSGIISVQAKGQVLLGPAYTSLLGVQPGDSLQVKVVRGKILVSPVSTDDEPDEEPTKEQTNGRAKKQLAIAR